MIEIFSGPQCGFCKKAKELLDAKGLGYTDLDVSEEVHRNAFAERLPRARSIPQIFIDGEHIGGYEDLCIWDERGRLDALSA
jgi:glutaredoxin 3